MKEVEQTITDDKVLEYVRYIEKNRDLLMTIEKQEKSSYENPTKVIMTFTFLKELKK